MTLAPGHGDELRRSGLTDETITRAGCYSATGAGVRDLLGFGGGPGLVFPYPELNGSGPYARVKLDRHARRWEAVPLAEGSPESALHPDHARSAPFSPTHARRCGSPRARRRR